MSTAAASSRPSQDPRRRAATPPTVDRPQSKGTKVARVADPESCHTSDDEPIMKRKKVDGGAHGKATETEAAKDATASHAAPVDANTQVGESVSAPGFSGDNPADGDQKDAPLAAAENALPTIRIPPLPRPKQLSVSAPTVLDPRGEGYHMPGHPHSCNLTYTSEAAPIPAPPNAPTQQTDTAPPPSTALASAWVTQKSALVCHLKALLNHFFQEGDAAFHAQDAALATAFAQMRADAQADAAHAQDVRAALDGAIARVAALEDAVAAGAAELARREDQHADAARRHRGAEKRCREWRTKAADASAEAARLRRENAQLHEDAAHSKVEFARVYQENVSLREREAVLEARVGILEEQGAEGAEDVAVS